MQLYNQHKKFCKFHTPLPAKKTQILWFGLWSPVPVSPHHLPPAEDPAPAASLFGCSSQKHHDASSSRVISDKSEQAQICSAAQFTLCLEKLWRNQLQDLRDRAVKKRKRSRVLRWYTVCRGSYGGPTILQRVGETVAFYELLSPGLPGCIFLIVVSTSWDLSQTARSWKQFLPRKSQSLPVILPREHLLQRWATGHSRGIVVHFDASRTRGRRLNVSMGNGGSWVEPSFLPIWGNKS